MIGIYKITSPSGRIYIGQSKEIEVRFKHYRRLHSIKQPRLHNSFLKYGVINHIFEIIEECDIELLNERERYYQEYYDVLDNDKGLNCLLTITNEKHRIVSEETRLKISNAKKGNTNMLGKSLSKEAKLKISLANTGKKHSEESKKKMSEFRKGKIISEETKLKMSISGKDRVFSEETKLKMSNVRKGIVFSEVTLKKMSISSKWSKVVICTITNNEWYSIKEASIQNSIPINRLYNMLRGITKNTTSLKYKLNGKS